MAVHLTQVVDKFILYSHCHTYPHESQGGGLKENSTAMHLARRGTRERELNEGFNPLPKGWQITPPWGFYVAVGAWAWRRCKSSEVWAWICHISPPVSPPQRVRCADKQRRSEHLTAFCMHGYLHGCDATSVGGCSGTSQACSRNGPVVEPWTIDSLPMPRSAPFPKRVTEGRR